MTEAPDVLRYGLALAVLVAWAMVRAPSLGRWRGGLLVIASVALVPSAGLHALSGVALAEAVLSSGERRPRWTAAWLCGAVLLRPDLLAVAGFVLLTSSVPWPTRPWGRWRALGVGALGLATCAIVNGWLAGYRSPEPIATASPTASALGLLTILAAGWLAHEHAARRQLAGAIAIAAVSAWVAPDVTFAAALILATVSLRDGQRGPRVAIAAVVAAVAAAGALASVERGPSAATETWAGAMDACVEPERLAACDAAVLDGPVYDAREVAVRPFFGPRLLRLHRDLVFDARLSAGAVGLRRRERPARIGHTSLGVSRYYLGRLEVHREQVVRFERSLREDALVELDLEIGGTWLEPPELSARAIGRGYRGPATRIPLRHGRQRVYIPVDPQAAAWRWTTGGRGHGDVADGVALTLIGSALRSRSAEVTVRSARSLEPPPDPSRAPCVNRARFTLEDALTEGDAAAADDGIRLGAGRASFIVPACPDTCFYAELGLEEGAAAAQTEIVIEGRGRPRVVSRREIDPGWRQPLVADLEGDGQDTVVRVETDAPVRLYWPRVRSCAGPFSVIHALHEGRFDAAPPELAPELIGDELRLPIVARDAPRSRVEVPFQLEPGQSNTCLAIELDSLGHEPPAGLLVGLRRGRRVYWLARHAHASGAPRIELRDLPIGRFAGEPGALVFSAWAYGEGGGTAKFIRPRTHPCGVEPWWMF